MRLNAADRSFFALVATVLIPYGLLGLLGCGVLSLLAYRLAGDGWAGLTRDGQDLRPAALFFAIVVGGTVIGVRSAHRQVMATRALAAEVAARRVVPTEAVDRAAAAAGLGGRVDVVEDGAAYSFTYGITSPRVVLSTGLVDGSTPEELGAVLQHERYHVRSGDTAKCVVARAASSAFFFLPALGHLRDRYLSGRELAADRAAVRAVGQRALAGALVNALDAPAWTDLRNAAALGGGVLERRIEQLEAGSTPPLPRTPPRALALTSAALAALVGLFTLTIARGGSDLLAMDASMPDSPGGAVVTMLGSLACTAAMAALVVSALRSGRHHRRLG
jgi:Zn-dependent protease with chaperone function